MPLDFICRFRCDHCGVEHGDVGRVSVESFPIQIQSFAILKPPTGWTVNGATALCPEHAPLEEENTSPLRVVKPKPHEIMAALKGH